MNRFRTKKKAKDTEGPVRVSNDSETSTSLKSTMTFRRGKKNNQEPDPKPQFDVANALPSNDDLRTSLLMNGLSARFSMLREQDDPNSKLGKASDDSVLFPKRQSRLVDFGFQPSGLHDIAEVSSINTSVRPPFLSSSRAGSYHSVDTDDSGGIMSRARPGEGNNLFGGRQKIYKIPIRGSGKGSTMGGRALYDDDVSQSAFQKLREREREEQEHGPQEQSQQEDDRGERTSLNIRSTSPLGGYNYNRETSSTTSSGPSLTRSSTAATSVTSQGAPSVNGHSSPSTPSVPNQPNPHGLDRSKTKRLYETGLDLHLQSQQYSAINRLENLSRLQIAEGQSPSPTLSSPSNTFYDSATTAMSASQNPSLRSVSPPLSSTMLRRFDSGAKMSNVDPQKQSYISPATSDGEDYPVLPIQPNDRGKATALGAFSKPTQPYDENKFAQRQLQMKENGEIPPFRKGSPPRPLIAGQQPISRARAESGSTHSSGQSRPPSVPQENLVYKHAAPRASTSDAPDIETQIKSGSFLSSPTKSLLNPTGENSLEDPKSWSQPANLRRPMKGNYSMVYHNAERPPESEHPANRQSSPQRLTNRTTEITHPDIPRIVEEAPVGMNSPVDSPTLGPETGLSGMVRQHLRADSSTSSVDGAPSSGSASKISENLSDNISISKGSAREMDISDQGQHIQQNGSIYAESENPGTVNRPFPKAPPFMTSRSSEDIMDSSQVSPKTSWEKDRTPNHSRDVSLETRKERDEFANELATRRMRVQATLRSRVESDNPSDWSRDMNSTKSSLMGMQKSKPGRGSIIVGPPDNQPKPMKMLGIGHSTISSSLSPNSHVSTEEMWRKEEEEMLRGVKPPNILLQTRQFRQARRDAQRDRERQALARHQPRDLQDFGDRGRPVQDERDYSQQRPDRLYNRRAPSRESKDSASSNQSSSALSKDGRDRSGSDTSTRSKGRNDAYHNDISKAMVGGHPSPSKISYQDAAGRLPVFNGVGLPPSPNASWSAVNGTRSRSNSKSPSSRTFDHQIQPIQTGSVADIGISPRPSPLTPYSINSTPALAQLSPTGPGPNTPTTQGSQNYDRNPGGRKRSINKSDISEPTLVSKTSQIVTVDLPHSASLHNGMSTAAPPLPPMHPRRQQTRTQTLYGALTGRGNDPTSIPLVSPQSQPWNMSSFPVDEPEKKPRQKLRKISSEGGNLNSRARQALAAIPSPALPGLVSRIEPAIHSGEGTMF